MTDLASLDSRLRNLEKAMYVALPTPDADPSWLGLTTRLWRLRNNILKDGIAVFLGREATAVQDFQSMLPDVDISLDSIKKAVGSIRTLAPRTEWPKSSSGEQMMSVILQTLCHIIGWRNNLIGKLPVTPIDMYIYAVEMSQIAEIFGQTQPRPIPRPPAGPIPIPRPIPRNKKACCNCCACRCHSMGDVRGRKSSRSRPGRRTKWLGRLLFWRKKPVDDTASVSSSGSSTIVD